MATRLRTRTAAAAASSSSSSVATQEEEEEEEEEIVAAPPKRRRTTTPTVAKKVARTASPSSNVVLDPLLPSSSRTTSTVAAKKKAKKKVVASKKTPKKKTTTEKRLRPTRTSASESLRMRIERALSQRLYLIAQTKDNANTTRREFKVLGQTGNVYTVVITHLPSCTCPDHLQGHLCKHIVFVMHRVLKVARNSTLLFQQALLTDELHDIFAKADSLQRIDTSVLAERQVREAYRDTTGDPDAILSDSPAKGGKKKTTDEPKEEPKSNRKPVEEQDCPICFDAMEEKKEQVIFCANSCGNNMHKACFDKWRDAKKSQGEPVTCPFCRVEWKDVKPTGAGGGAQATIVAPWGRREYLNLAQFRTTSRNNDENRGEEEDEEEYDEDADDMERYYTGPLYYSGPRGGGGGRTRRWGYGW